MPTWSDAWLLWAISLSPGSLSEALAVADGINHAIPTRSEWEHACMVLGQRGLIESADPLPSVTDLGQEVLSGFEAAYASFHPLAAKLAELPVVTDIRIAAPSQEALRLAYEAYCRRFEETFEKMTRERQAESASKFSVLRLIRRWMKG